MQRHLWSYKIVVKEAPSLCGGFLFYTYLLYDCLFAALLNCRLVWNEFCQYARAALVIWVSTRYFVQRFGCWRLHMDFPEKEVPLSFVQDAKKKPASCAKGCTKI